MSNYKIGEHVVYECNNTIEYIHITSIDVKEFVTEGREIRRVLINNKYIMGGLIRRASKLEILNEFFI